jgi:3-deoxy-D-manno-octulosonic-acid transferase
MSNLRAKRDIVWMHASSLGEFEQGKPLLDALKQINPSIGIVVSFFSPSGYEVVKNAEGPDVVTYLPTDTPANAIRFFDLVKPNLVLWIKYDYWYHHLKNLQKHHVPVLLVSSITWNDSIFFKWYGSLHRSMLHCYTQFFMQNQSSALLMKSLLRNEGLPESRVSVGGDTRFDRVIDIAENWMPVVPIEDWLNGDSQVVVAGSTWPEDDEELAHYVRTNADKKFIIAPHQLEAETLKDTMKMFGGAVLFSDLLGEEVHTGKSNVLIINNIGLLSRIYQYAYVCYVGGGFSGSGIHNVLEAAVYGKPVVHGPDFEKYQEAIDLEEAGGSFAAENAIELEKQLDLLFSDEAAYRKAASASRNFVYQSKGSTQKIVDYIYENRLLTSR